MTRTTITAAELGLLPDADFLAHCRKYRDGCMWADHLAYQYAATRLARIQGLVVAESRRLPVVAKAPCEKQMVASWNV